MIDPITLEVMRHRLFAIAEEMGATLIRTSYSTNIKDRRDASCALFDRKGETIAQAEHIPIHLGVLPWGVKGALQHIDIDSLQPGDAIVHNDPFIGGTHTPDIIIFTPIFFEDELVGFAGNLAHHIDVGGPAPGSLPPSATEIFQEGFRLPPLKIREAGRLNETVLRIFRHNIRTPYEGVGDLLGQIAANYVGEQRFLEACTAFGKSTLLEGIEALVDYCDRRMQAEIAKIPDGTYRFTDSLDPLDEHGLPIEICVQIEVQGHEISFDFTGSSPQVAAPLNAVHPMTLACIYYTLRAVTDPTLPSNAGTFRCVKAHTPEGTIVNARFPAATGMGNSVTCQRIVDALLGAFAQALPDKVCAACTGSMNGLTIGGFDRKTQRYYSYVETYGGGYGGHSSGDGESGVHTHMTNTRNAPVEVIESILPVKVETYSLVPNSEGAGRFRGGLGIKRVFRIEADEVHCQTSTNRVTNGPWGLAGGKPASGPRYRVMRSNGEEITLSARSSVVLNTGDRLSIETAGGGGWGDPLKRAKSAVLADIKEGLISKEHALSEYRLDR